MKKVERNFDGCIRHRKWKASRFVSVDRIIPQNKAGEVELKLDSILDVPTSQRKAPPGINSGYPWYGSAEAGRRQWLQLKRKNANDLRNQPKSTFKRSSGNRAR